MVDKQRGFLGKNMTNNEPNIYNYHDYRSYLRDMLYFYKKHSKRKISLRTLAGRSKVSPALLSLILRKERNLTAELAERIGYEFALNGQQISYFKLLLILCDTKENDERIKTFQKLKRFHEFRDKNKNDIEANQYIADWYNVVIREMVNLPDFSREEKNIQEKLIEMVPLDRIRRSYQFLIENGYINENEEGLVSAQKNINCSGGVYKLSLSKFYEDILKVAAKSIYTTDSEHRHLLGHTVALSRQDYLEVVKIIEKSLKEVQQIQNKKTAEAVYHVSFMCFPLTNRAGSD